MKPYVATKLKKSVPDNPVWQRKQIQVLLCYCFLYQLGQNGMTAKSFMVIIIRENFWLRNSLGKFSLKLFVLRQHTQNLPPLQNFPGRCVLSGHDQISPMLNNMTHFYNEFLQGSESMLLKFTARIFLSNLSFI